MYWRQTMYGEKPVSLNLNVRGLELSATLDINERCHAARHEHRTVFNLGLGQSPFPVPSSVVEALRLTARLAYVDFDGARALPASENIPLHAELPADFTRKWCERVLPGVERIAQWVAAAS